MPKFGVYGLWTASKYLGVVEAESAEEAERMVLDGAALIDESYVSLCHQCAGELDIGDMYKVAVTPVEEGQR